MDNRTFEIRVRGIVQGVGFRPFIYRIANELSLKGEVLNDTEGVLIRINAKTFEIPGIEMKIRGESPPLSTINSIETKEIDQINFTEFNVVESEITDQKSAFIPPDTAICDDCRRELFDKNDHRYKFPFINCTNCGPRFSIIRDIPYDRKQTSMHKFHMCSKCQSEYENPSDRRFHTEPTSCPVCGPRYFLYDKDRKLLAEQTDKIISMCSEYLKNGKIVAIKGEGGYHLAVDAENNDSVRELRERKQRPFKPFALMVRDLSIAEEFLEIPEVEKGLLLERERPIVILKERKKRVSDLVAPELTHLGIMLPYSPLQHLIFEEIENMVLIMTSGNISDEPIISEEEELFEKLACVADYFITSDREIIQQSDDSVLFVNDESPYMIRRAKGFVPVPFFSSHSDSNIFAAGSDIKNSFALSKENLIFLSQYIGDLESPLTEQKYIKTIDHFKNLFQIEPSVFVSDLHPGYFSTKITDRLWSNSGTRIKVQHHHAHIAAVLEENEIDDKVIGISFDGTGFGEDGNIWGGEFLIADKREYSRAAHFSYFPLPGGEAAIKDVWRIGLSLLITAFGKDPMAADPKRKIIAELIEKNINSPLCCSVGRLFDGISSLLGFSDSISTESEAAQLLEEAALRSDTTLKFPLEISGGSGKEPLLINSSLMVKELIRNKERGIPADDLALAFHNSIADITIKTLKLLKNKTGINRVALSGGVFHNRLLLRMIEKYIRSEKFELLLPKELPFNDGAIAFGQIVSAKARLKD
ncbi:MAG: carbamoyltransferase HypF [Candidatus Aminicenantes bacterium]|nr:carbamoyltransferase HypF [Candidatus Aminicenantes bacterium]